MCDVVYNTPMNTIGIGDPVPFGSGTNSVGSGDRFGSIFPKMPKAPKMPKMPKFPGKPFVKAPAPPVFGGMPQMPLLVMANQVGKKKSKKKK